MSVPVGKRGENTLEVWQKAVRLAKYTMEITSNKKNFPARYDAMTSRIVDCAVDAAGDLWHANRVYIGHGCDPRALEDRRYLQNKAVNELDDLLFLIDLAGKVLHRDTRKTVYWADLARGVKQMAVKWRDSDRGRG